MRGGGYSGYSAMNAHERKLRGLLPLDGPAPLVHHVHHGFSCGTNTGHTNTITPPSTRQRLMRALPGQDPKLNSQTKMIQTQEHDNPSSDDVAAITTAGMALE